MELMSLSENVIKALDFFSKNKPTIIDINQFSLPFVVGSGNAYNTGMILFSDKAAIFADESNFKKLLGAYKSAIDKGLIKQVVIISASGEKDSVWEVNYAHEHGLETYLFTTKANSSAAKIANHVYVFRSIDEPYTYNVSTYMGMILSLTKENPDNIKKLINNLVLPNNFGEFEAYAFILPDKFIDICPMLEIKKSELFGPYISIRAFSSGHARHAKFVIRSEKELVISIGVENKYFGDPKSRFDIKIEPDTDYAGIMALTYYLIGKIQELKPAYFKDNIESYCNDYGPKAYGTSKLFDVIVPGSN